MKIRRLFLLALLIFGVTVLSAADGYDVSFSQPTNSEYKLTFEIDEFKLMETVKNGVTYSEIDFAGGVVTTRKGYAELPFLSAAVQLKNRNVDVEIVITDYDEYKLAYPLLPSRGIIYRGQDPAAIPYEIAAESVVDRFYPDDMAIASQPYILRDIRGTNVYVYPFQYNAARNILRVYKKLEVRLIENNTTPINPLTRTSAKIAREMDNLYQTVFINYDRTRFEYELGELGSILVIHTARDVTAIAPYIQWKQQKGFTVYQEEVETNTNVTSLVADMYEAHNDILYVQLVGDWQDINGPTYIGSAADPKLGCVAGADSYPDLIIGRFSASTADQVTTQVDKTITYERNPASEADWYHHGLGIASNQGPGDDDELDYEHLNVIKNYKLLPSTYTQITDVYDPSGTVTDIANAVNDGTSIINYTGHGSHTAWITTGFSNSHVANLSNGSKLPFIIATACYNGEFHSGGDCFAEAWLKEENAGAVAMYASSISQSWNPPMRGQDYINDLLVGGYDYDFQPGDGISTDVQKTTFGALCSNGSILMTVEDFSTGLSILETWNIFGDASLQVRTDTPAEISLTNTNIIKGIDFSTTVYVGGNLVEGAVVSLYQDGVAYTGISDASGNVNISHQLDAGTCTLIVTAFNGLTIFNEDTPVTPLTGPYVVYESHIIHDSDGNDNGLVDYDETITLDLSLINLGTETATNVDVTISTENEYITITDNTENFGNIDPDLTSFVSNAFTFEVAGGIPDGMSIIFTLSATGQETWESTFMITAHAPVLEFVQFEIDDSMGNNNNLIDPGETADIIVTIANEGSSEAKNVIGLLRSSDAYLVVNDNSAEYGNLDPGLSNDQAFSVTAHADTPAGYMAALIFDITAEGNYSGIGAFDVQIGNYLIDEPFASFPPVGWTTTGGNNWRGSNTNNAGGAAPEAEFYWDPQTVGIQRLISPQINTGNMSELFLEFKHAASHYSGDYQLRIETTGDGENWNIIQSYPAENLESATENFIIDNDDVGSETFQVAWVFDGDSYNIWNWWVDDVLLGGGVKLLGTISGTVSLQGGEGNVEDVLIEIDGDQATHPDDEGNFSLNVFPGTYAATASLEGYESQTHTDVVVVEGETINISFTLIYSVDSYENQIPLVTGLQGNYPNPFNPSTTIAYSIKEDTRVSLEIYNIKGQKVKTLVNESQTAGYHKVIWNGVDRRGRKVASGVYFYRLKTGNYISAKKMLLLK